MNAATSTFARAQIAQETLYPLRFAPIIKRLLWGGRRLESVLNKSLGPGDDHAESWELADHRDDVSRVAEGPLAGRSLRDLVRRRPVDVLGPALSERAQFPLLVKFLDAHQVLSVQVHPDDVLGRTLAGDNGKTEAWVVVHAEPGSTIYAGLRPGVTRDQFAEALTSGEVERLLHSFEAREGDCVFIPAGTVHAIGSGIIIAEIQQMSDATFRVSDWGRVGADGRPRALHVEQALASINFAGGPVDPVVAEVEPFAGGSRERLVRCPYFALERLRLTGPSRLGTPDMFTILMNLGGPAEVTHDGTSRSFDFGETLLLPALLGPCEVAPTGQSTTILTCVVPGNAAQE